MVQLQFFGLLRLLLKVERLDLFAVDGETVSELLHRAQKQLPIPFVERLLGGEGRLQPGTVILVREYGLLVTNKGLSPPDGLSIFDFWKQTAPPNDPPAK